MKSLLRVLLVVPLTLFAIKAGRADDAKPVESAYYPMKVGSVWHYKAGEAKIDMKVAKYEEYEKELCARLESSVGGNVVEVEYVTVKEDGLYRVGISKNKVEPALKFITLPAVDGKTWEVNSKSGADEIKGTFKSGMVAEVTVAAGTYKDVYTSSGDVKVGATPITFTYFLAKDVGMIKQTIKLPDREIVIELEKYEPGN